MFVFGRQYGATVCEIYKNDFHKNIAYLIVLGITEDITVIDRAGKAHTGSDLLVHPMVEHMAVRSPSTACHVFLAPNSALAASLARYTSESGILELPLGALPFNSAMPADEILSVLDRVMMESNAQLDPRLAAVLDDLQDAPYKATISDIVSRCGLSPSRLRVLAKEQIGVSLSTLILWRKLVKAMQVLASGASVSEAAQVGGFSDQAHFSRTMRKMFGITPSNSTHALGCRK